jgi:hypothetical protein
MDETNQLSELMFYYSYWLQRANTEQLTLHTLRSILIIADLVQSLV